jgi:tetratricopeptide (TPR) repeat protein
VNLARAYLLGHRLDDAVAGLDRAIRCEAGLASLYRTRARVHLLRRDEAAALADLECAGRLGADAPPAARAHDLLECARILLRRHQYERALDACARALRLNPTARGYRLRAEVLIALKRYEAAATALDACLEKSPNDALVLCARAAVRTRLGQYQGAQADYARALERKPDAEVYTARGWTYLAGDATKLALADFDLALRLEPGRGDALMGRGLAHALLGEHGRAVADTRQALASGPESSRLYYNAARVHALVASRANRTAAPPRRPGLKRGDHARQATQLLANALDCVPAGERASFWRDVVLADPLLRSLRLTPEFQVLAARAGRKGTGS